MVTASQRGDPQLQARMIRKESGDRNPKKTSGDRNPKEKVEIGIRKESGDRNPKTTRNHTHTHTHTHTSGDLIGHTLTMVLTRPRPNN